MSTLLSEQDMINAAIDAADFGKFVNDAGPTFQTRLGATLRTLQGHLTNLGYEVPVAYTSGLNITLATQTVEESGVVYAPYPSSLPISSTPSTFDPDDWYPIQIPERKNLLSEFTDFADALSNMGSHGTLIIDGNETLGASTYTVPSGVNIITSSSGVLTLGASTTLNVNGLVYGVDQWIDATTGTCNFNNQDIDIRWFGAVAGSSSAAEINAAIAAAETNNVGVYVPEGTFKITTALLMKDDVRLYGKSWDLSIIQAIANAGTIVTVTSDNNVIHDLQFDANSYTINRIISNKGENCRYFNLKCHNTAGSAPGDNVTSSGTVGIDVNGTTTNLVSTTIEDCEFYELGIGVKISNGPKNTVIRRNKFSRFGLGGIVGVGETRATTELRMYHNHFSNPLGGGAEDRFGISLRSLSFGYTNILCNDNMVIGNDFPWRPPGTLQATDPVSFPAATKNDYVFFTANATVDGQSVLAGENWICITTTAGGDAGDWQLIKSSLTDGLEFENVDGLIVSGNYVFGTGGSGIALRDDCSNGIVEINHLISCDVNGIELGTNSTTGTDILCQNNFIHNCCRDQAANYTVHGGLYLKDLEEGMVTNNKIFCDITTSEQMPYGIVIEDCTALLEEHNDVVGWASSGSRVDESGTNTFSNEQQGLATTGTIDWDAAKGGEIQLSDANGVLSLPSSVRPGLRPILRIKGGYDIDVSAFTVISGMYDRNVGASTLNIAQFEFDKGGTAYLSWIQGIPVLTDATRPAASSVQIGAFFYNTDDNQYNYSDGTNWRKPSDGGTT